MNCNMMPIFTVSKCLCVHGTHMHRKWTRQSSMPGGSMKIAGSLNRLHSTF